MADAETDAYYADEAATDEELDLSFLDDDEKGA